MVTYPDVKRVYLPIVCNHCRSAACERVCRTGATHRREDGIVLVDHEKCDEGSKVRRLIRQRGTRVLLPECDTDPSVY